MDDAALLAAATPGDPLLRDLRRGKPFHARIAAAGRTPRLSRWSVASTGTPAPPRSLSWRSRSNVAHRRRSPHSESPSFAEAEEGLRVVGLW